MTFPFRAGEPCLLLDRKGRRYLVQLAEGGEFQFHRGTVGHEQIIGNEDGAVIASSLGAKLVALRPRLADFILAMPRGAQVVYPKDLGQILMWADIAPGQLVLEAGTGSGALAMTLARAVGPGGRVVSVEERDDHRAHAERMVIRYFGSVPDQLEIRAGRVEDAIAEVRPQRLVVDIPEPWHIVRLAAEHLTPGGILCAYLPTVPQVQQLREAVSEPGVFTMVETFEVLYRSWSVEGRSVRPEHRMVGHTGFITVARRAQPIRD